MAEIWRDIEGYEGLYQVSNSGKVKSIVKGIGRRSQELKLQYKNGGYAYLNIYDKDGKGKKYYIHRLVAITFLKNINNYKIVNHIDCNKANNNVINLEWCTQKHNIAESIKNGLQTRAYETTLINELTGNIKKFRSMLDASNFLGKKYNTISYKKDYLKSNDFKMDGYLISIKEVMPTCHV